MKHNKLIDISVLDLIKCISSDSPAPGGGATSAMALCLGCALMIMSVKVSMKRGRSRNLMKHLTVFEDVLKETIPLIDDDTRAFMDVIESCRRKDSRRQQRALKVAASIPLSCAANSVKLLRSASEVYGDLSSKVSTDFYVGILLTEASLKGCTVNVDVNVNSVEDEDFNRQCRERLERIHKEAKVLLDSIFEAISSG
jgi:formiminotetrahydrofolate cyclodeaminase